MSELQQIIFHDAEDEDRVLEIQFFPDRLYISIEWPVGKGGLGGMRAESFELTGEEARRTARDILERLPSVETMESLPPEYEPSKEAKHLADILRINPFEKWSAIIDCWSQHNALYYLAWASRQSASEPSGEVLTEVSPGTYMTPLRDAAEHLFGDLTDGWVITTQNGLIDCIEEHLRALLASRPESKTDKSHE